MTQISHGYVIYQHRIYRDDLRANPDILYVFGDNCERIGSGGQAGEMRGEPNAVGVRTKKRPSMEEDAFFTDDEATVNMAMIYKDLQPILDHLEKGGIVVCPLDGIGTGYSELPKRAPQTFAFLREIGLAGPDAIDDRREGLRELTRLSQELPGGYR